MGRRQMPRPHPFNVKRHSARPATDTTAAGMKTSLVLRSAVTRMDSAAATWIVSHESSYRAEEAAG
jgi:hypothetical protein